VAEQPTVIAIDGPAASGKSSTGAAVARELGALHLDSGALYRAMTVVHLEDGGDESQLVRRAELRGLELREAGGALVPFLDDADAEPLLRTPAVNQAVSTVSAWPAVRAWVTARLREAATANRPVVFDGRDIGTAVFPEAPVKIFLTATPEARARRRLLQQGQRAEAADIAREAALLAERDRKDSSRPVAPLTRAADAELVDSTELDFSEAVGEIVRLVRRRLPGL
jgi:cytidylate kinase